MSNIINITLPLSLNLCASLKAGDDVLISGTIIAARDAAHRRMLQCLEQGEDLPFQLAGALIYYVGPSPARPVSFCASSENSSKGTKLMPTGSAGPTTSGRMDTYTPALLELGVLGTLGKGTRSRAVVESMRKNGAVYFAATGGAGALLAQKIKSYKVLAWPELGPEALAEMQVENFPAIVAIDSFGNNIYEFGPKDWRQI